jgi:glycosyltransferase involved in cell wall biosynthesis
LRILYIMPAEGFGGAERQGVLHIANLPKLGVEVVAVTGPGQPIRRELDRAGVTGYVWCTDFPDLSVEARGLLPRLLRPWIYYRSWARATHSLVELGRRERVDLVLASRTFGWIVGSVVARQLDIPVIWRVGSLPSKRGHWFSLRRLASLIAPSALVANSEAGRQVYSRFVRVPSAVLPNGVDTRRFSPEHASTRLRSELGLDHTPVIGLAARPAPEKGLGYFAEVVRIIASSRPHVRFLIAGEFSWRSFYQRQFEEMGLGQTVTLLGHVGNIESFYASCDVIVLTSLRSSVESSSNAVLEAMSTARPVVVTDVGAMSELVEEGVSGYLVSPDEPALFASRLTSLIESPDLRGKIGADARKRILQRHSQEEVGATLASILFAVRGIFWPRHATATVRLL